MRILLALMLLCSVASAQNMAGMTVGVQPAHEIDHGGLGMWFAREVGAGYLGGELSVGSYVTPNDAGLSFHGLAGVRTRISKRALVLTDVGIGATQQFDYHLGILGGEDRFETVRWMPSGAARVQLVGVLGIMEGTSFGIALATEARIGYADGETTRSAGIGIGLYLGR